MIRVRLTGHLQRHYIRPRGKIKVRGKARLSRPQRKSAVVVLVGMSLLGACATGPRLEPVAAPSPPGVTLTEAGVRLTVLPNTWSGYPGDLSRYFTPMEVTIENARDDELQIRYEDFVALDDGKHQYRAVPPAEVARAMSGARGPSEPTTGFPPILLAGPWHRHWPRYWHSSYGPYGPWGYWDPYYSPYAWPRPAAQEVLTLGLREGPLLPGASVQGFIFFQQATARGNILSVSWTPRLSNGALLPPLSSQFRIIR